MLEVKELIGFDAVDTVGCLRRRLFGHTQRFSELFEWYPRICFWGAFTPDPVGYIIGHAGSETLELVEGGVLPGARRQGIATAGLQHVLNWARNYQMTTVKLCVERIDIVSRALYTQFGFQDQRIFPHYYGRGRDMVRMQVRL